MALFPVFVASVLWTTLPFLVTLMEGKEQPSFSIRNTPSLAVVVLATTDLMLLVRIMPTLVLCCLTRHSVSVSASFPYFSLTL